jgi:hypothetical protein
MIDILNIINSWTKSIHSSESEKRRAEERLHVCHKCEHYTEVIKKRKWSAICGSCGCPLKAKVFSNVFEPCPENYWSEVDKKYQELPKVKENKTLL